MDKKKEDTLLAFTEWLDNEFDGYIILTTKDGDTSLICNGKKESLTVSLASAIMKYEEIADIIFDASEIIMNILNNKELN